MHHAYYARTEWMAEDVIRIAKDQGFSLSREEAIKLLDELEDDIQIAQQQAGDAIIRREVTLT